MAGIKIPFLADVREFMRGTKDVSRGLDDVADSLDDVGRDARKAGDEVGDELRDGGREAERSADKLERKFRDAFDEVKDDSRKAGRDLGDNVKDGARKAERAVDGFKDEAQQNFAETASSFDGSMDSIADMAQSTLGGLATAIPGAGIALAGLGAAAGVFYTQWQENAERVKERISEMYQDMLASGERFLSEGFVNQSIADWIDEVDPGRLAQHESAAADLGIEMGTAVRAMNGDAAAAQDVLAKAAEYLATAQGSARVDVQGMVDAINAQQSAADSAAAKTDLYQRSVRATGEAAAGFDKALADLPAAVEEANAAILGNVESLGSHEAAADLNRGVLADMRGELTGVRDAAVEAGVSGEDLAAIERDLAARFMATARQAGLTAQEAEDLAREYDLIPDDVETQITAETRGANRDVDALQTNIAQTQGRTVTMGVRLPDLPSLQYQVDRLARGIRPPVIGVNVIAGKVVV